MIKYYCKKCDKVYTPDGINGRDSTCRYCGGRAELHSSMLYWCKACNIPVYDEVCPRCHTKGIDFTFDARPVFPEERLLLEIILRKPLAFLRDSVWNGTGNRYYVNGEKVPFSLSSIENLDADEVRGELEKYSPQNSYDAFNSMVERWAEANAGRYQ